MDYVSVWDKCLQIIRSNVNEQSYKTWFEPIKPVKLEDNALTIQVPNKFFYEWLEEHYVRILKRSIRQELGDKARLEYQIRVDHTEGFGGSVTNGANSNGAAQNVAAPTHVPDPYVVPGIRKAPIESHLNPSYLFSNYIEGDCNRLARSAGEAVAANPGKTAFNPLFVFGAVGLGKTHLAQAIGNEIKIRNGAENVLYVTSEKFTNEIIQAIKANETSDFVNRYQMLDVLIVDDIQFLANKLKTQEIFFHIFNQLHQTGKQIILTSDRSHKEMPDIQERLTSRFKWGLSADLQTPDLETRMAILESKLQGAGVDVPRDVVEYICYNIQSNIRELEGVAASILAHTSLTKRRIDMELAQEVIQNFIVNATHEVTIGKIKKLVSDYFDIPVERLKSKTRVRDVAMARQICMYLAKEMTNQSLKSIGDAFGGRDHSTVIYSRNAVQDLMDTDPDYRKVIGELIKQIKMDMSA